MHHPDAVAGIRPRHSFRMMAFLSAVVAIVLYGVTIIAASGCGASPAFKPSPLIDAGNASARIGRALDTIEGAAGRVRDNKPQVDQIKEQTKFARGDVVELDSALSASTQVAQTMGLENRKLTDENAELKTSFWSPRQKRLYRLAWILLAVSIVIRAIALKFGKTGGVGLVLAFIATAINAVLSFGVSLVQAIFDNLWFRVFAKEKAKEEKQPAELYLDLTKEPKDAEPTTAAGS